MKIEAYLFAFVFVFLTGTDIVYWYVSHDPTGTTALALAASLGLLVSSYLYIVGKQIGPRLEDLPDADIADGAGEVGFFSPYSWAPLWCAGSAAMVFSGVVFGWWLSFLGGALAVPAVGSMLFQYYDGDAPI